ncbi:MAG: MotA/TolQ/ExbB proton channel family protein [Candidatus Omnitrophica bacterium]|nr:MotA/TolQ/ExbB proton channel family protein [Candidatus Omnitrophota bacterium]
MLEIFQKGGLIMWPLLLASVVTLTVVFERTIFIFRERRTRDPKMIEYILTNVEQGNIDGSIRRGEQSLDFVVRTLVYGLKHREKGFSNALLQKANQELKRFSQGLTTLDTIITLAPLLGLLGTVTGMINAFGLIGGRELETPSVITGGIAEALIATAFGLAIAIVSLIPFNYLNGRLEDARHEIEDASTHLELLLRKPDRRLT